MNKKHIISFLLFIVPLLGLAQKKIPRPIGMVNDYAHMLSQQELLLLERKLQTYKNETSIEIAVVTESTVEGENVNDYAFRLATDPKWQIGGAENDNGILLFIARSERKATIQTGYGTEGFLPDAIAFDIISGTIAPAFQSGNFYQGIDQAMDRIMELGRGEYTNDNPNAGRQQRRRARGFSAGFYIFLMILVIILLNTFNRRNNGGGGYNRGGRYDDRRGGGGWFIFPGFGGFGGSGGDDWGGFGGGGGFGGFGGGDFGGGGALGDW